MKASWNYAVDKMKLWWQSVKDMISDIGEDIGSYSNPYEIKFGTSCSQYASGPYWGNLYWGCLIEGCTFNNSKTNTGEIS